MEGIEILTTEVVQGSGDNITVIGIIIGCIALMTLVLSLYFLFRGENFAFLLIFVSIMVGVIACILIEAGTDPTSKKSYVKQQIVVDDSVRFNEFMEHYEIKDRDGKIWTVIVNNEDD